MLRSALFGLVVLASLSTEVLAQAVTRPTVTASASAVRAVFVGTRITSTTREEFDEARGLFALGLDGEVPILSRERLTASAGVALRAASDVFGEQFRPQSLNVYGRLGTAQTSALLGVSVDIGGGPFDSGSAINSDGQHAILGQLRGEAPVGPVRLFAQADGSIVLPYGAEILVTSRDDQDGRPYDVDVDGGNLLGIQAGAMVPLGPVEAGLALFYATRAEGSYAFTGDAPSFDSPQGEPFEVPSSMPIQLGYSEALGLIPSVAYRMPDERMTVRLEGTFSGYAQMENVPIGVTWTSENGPKTRPAVTVSVGVGL